MKSQLVFVLLQAAQARQAAASPGLREQSPRQPPGNASGGQQQQPQGPAASAAQLQQQPALNPHQVCAR